MKRLVPAFGVPLILAVGLTQGDAPLSALSPIALGDGSSYSPAPPLRTPGLAPSAPSTPHLRVTPLPKLVLPSVPPPRTPGDVIPHAYMVYGLRTGPGGTAFTDRNGVAIPVPSNPQISLKPFNGYPAVPPPSVAPPVIVRP